MNNNQEYLNQLLRKLEILWTRHKEMTQEILALRDEIQAAKAGGLEEIAPDRRSETADVPVQKRLYSYPWGYYYC